LMEENGFVGILVDSLAYTEVNTTSGVVDVYAQMTANVNDTSINVTSDVAVFLNKMSDIMEGVSGKIYYYNPYNTATCFSVLEAIADEVEGLPNLANGGSSAKTRNPNLMFTYKVTVVGIKDDDGSSYLYVKTKAPTNPHPGGKLINLQKFNDCELDLYSVRSYIKHFYKLLGTYKRRE